jgi:DedD protein
VVNAEVKPAPSKTDKTEPVAKPQDDGNKARALLEGKPPAAKGERHVVQVGAFSDPAKVREVRRKLEQAGLITFTQVVETPDGKSTTRVRVGPFSSREEADKAAAKVRKLDFSPAVLRI